MCGFCQQAQLLKDCGIDGPGSLETVLGVNTNADDRLIPGNTSTSATIAVGDTVDESLETAGDTDWFRIDLSAGDWIQINLTGVDHTSGDGLGALSDPYLRLRDSNGNVVAFDDDGGAGLNSQLSVSVDMSGTYYVEVDAYASRYAGNYRLSVEAVTAPSPVQAVQGANSLDDSDTLYVYFAQTGDVYRDFGETYVATGVNAYEQAQIWSVFEGVEAFADIDFEITTNRNQADLEFATDTLPTTPSGTLLGFFNFPDASGNGSFGVLNNNSNGFPNWNDTPGGTLDTGGFMYGVIVHELGHGLGLGHPHDSGNGTSVMLGVSSSGDRGNFELNSAPYTIMSYIEGSTVAGVASSTASTGHAATFGALDIAALQAFYGANTNHKSGNSVYKLDDSNATGAGAGFYTIWDTAGTDEIRYGGSKDAVIDLRAATLEYEEGGGGFLSYVDGVIGGRTIAHGVEIEVARGGNGDDQITGNSGDNTLRGRGGDDRIEGRNGEDRLVGAAGADILSGGADDDKLLGGSGGDTLYGGDGDDLFRAGRGQDKMTGGNGDDTFRFKAEDGSDAIDGGDGFDTYHARGADSGEFRIDNQGGGNWVITHIDTGHVDTLSSIERLLFDDTVLTA